MSYITDGTTAEPVAEKDHLVPEYHDVVTRYKICPFLCAWNVTSRYSLPYHHVVLMRGTLMYVFQSCIGG